MMSTVQDIMDKYIPVLMMQTKIYRDISNYAVGEKIYLQNTKSTKLSRRKSKSSKNVSEASTRKLTTSPRYGLQLEFAKGKLEEEDEALSTQLNDALSLQRQLAT